jgi:hypothetical protein
VIKRELKRRLTYVCRCDERLKAKTEGSTRLVYTGLRGGLEHPKKESRLINEMFENVMGECVILTTSIFKIIQSAATLERMFPHFDFIWETNTTWR